MAETIYVPGSSAKAKSTQFGEVIKLSFKIEDLGPFAKQHKNAKGYLNLEISPRKAPGKFGDTHSVKLDTWEPKEDGGQKQGGGKPTNSGYGKPAQKPAPKKPADPFDGNGDVVGNGGAGEDDEPPF
jgi:hypothetical protein